MDRKSAIMVSMGFEIVGIISAAVYIGGILDERYNWGGLGLIGAIVLGFIGWLTHLLLVVQILEKREAAEKTGKE